MVWFPKTPILLLGSLALVVTGCSSSPTSTQGASPDVGTTTQPNVSTSKPAPVQTENNPPGDIPDNQAFVTYTGRSGDYGVKIPEGWARTANGSSASFTDKLNTIAVEQTAAAAAPTVKTANSVVVPELQGSVPNFSLDNVTTFDLPGGSGTLITYRGDSAQDPVTNKVIRDAMERYTFWKNGQQVVLTLTGPENADNVDPWALVSSSFAWVQ